MKRTITLIRHADSDWGSSGLSDFDRPLNQRGKRDASTMGNILNDRNITFDLILASPAKRAFTTVNAICDALGYDTDSIEFRPDLYLAPSSDMVDIIQSVDDQHQNIAVVSHNPGLTALANMLGDLRIGNIPTCGIAILKTDIPGWHRLKKGSTVTTDFICPE